MPTNQFVVCLISYMRHWLPAFFGPLQQEKIVEFYWKPSAFSEQQGIRTDWGVSSPDNLDWRLVSFALNVPFGSLSLEILQQQSSGMLDLLIQRLINCPYCVHIFHGSKASVLFSNIWYNWWHIFFIMECQTQQVWPKLLKMACFFSALSLQPRTIFKYR